MPAKLLRKLCDWFMQSALGLPPYVRDSTSLLRGELLNALSSLNVLVPQSSILN